MTDFPVGDEGFIKFRVRENTDAIKELNSFRRTTEKQLVRVDSDIQTINKTLEKIDRRFDSLDRRLTGVQRTMIGLLVTIAVGATMLSLSILLGTGKLG